MVYCESIRYIPKWETLYWATYVFTYLFTFRCTVDLEKLLGMLEDQELKENVEVMKNLQDVILELKVHNWFIKYCTRGQQCV